MVGHRKKALNGSWFDSLNTLFMIGVAILTVYPMIYIVSISFSDSLSIMQNKVFLFPRGFNIDAYKEILMSDRVPRAYLNTIIYTSVGVALNLLMTAIAAYPLSRSTFFGRNFFMVAIVLTIFLNGGIIPTYLVVQKLGMVNTMWALIIPNVIWTFELLILKSFYENMPESLRESAKVDGASEYRILFSIIVPLSKPALASIGLFYFMGHWNSFFTPLIYLNDAKLYPLQLVLRDMLVFDDGMNSGGATDVARLTPEAMKNATIFITMIPVLIIYPFAQKYFAKGVMLGSVKE